MRKGRSWILVTLSSLVAATLLLGACSSEEAPAAPAAAPDGPKKGGTLNYVWQSNPTSLDIMQTTTNPDMEFTQVLYDYLIHITPGIALVPMQAESWKVGADNKSIVFTLRKGIKFHDGTDLNAAAVKNDLEFKMNEDNAFEQAGTLSAIKSIEVLDDLTFKITLEKLDALLMPNLASRPGQIMSPTARDATPKAERSTNPVGAGCFKYVEWISDSHMTAERWDSCFGSPQGFPYLDRVKVVIMSDPAVSMAAFKAKDVDTIRVAEDLVRELKGTAGVTLDSGNTPDSPAFWMSPRYPPFDDIRVRKAMQYALDREALITAVLDGRGFPLYGPIPRAHAWCFDENYKPFPYDVEAGKKLMAEAGFADGVDTGDITWWGKEAVLPRMNLLQDMFKDIGVNLKLTLVESVQASRGFRIDKKWAGYSSAWSGPTDIDRIFRDMFYSKSKSFYAEEPWPGVDEALDAARGTLDPAERCKHYTEAQRLIVEEHSAAIYTYNSFTTRASWDYVKGYQPFPEEGFQNLYEVSLDK